MASLRPLCLLVNLGQCSLLLRDMWGPDQVSGADDGEGGNDVGNDEREQTGDDGGADYDDD